MPQPLLVLGLQVVLVKMVQLVTLQMAQWCHHPSQSLFQTRMDHQLQILDKLRLRLTEIAVFLQVQDQILTLDQGLAQDQTQVKAFLQVQTEARVVTTTQRFQSQFP